MRGHLGLQICDLLGQLRQGGAVALLQLLDAVGQLLGNALNLRLDGRLQAGAPLILHQQLLDLTLCKLGVTGNHGPIQRLLRFFYRLFSLAFGFEPLDGGF